jgi:hypothetical protein
MLIAANGAVMKHGHFETLDNAGRVNYRCCGIRISARIVALICLIAKQIIEQIVHGQEGSLIYG